MGLIHTPRVLYNVGKGLLKRQRPTPTPTKGDGNAGDSNEQQQQIVLGVGPNTPHKYYSRVGIFDIDYLGHMNNAAYLSHCEYSRWEMCSTNGLLHGMIRTGSNFVVGSAAIRFRKEIRPLWQPFVIESFLCGINNRSLYIVQNFRTTTTKSKNENDNNKRNDRIVAQVLVEGLTIRGRTVIDPARFLIDDCKIHSKHIDALQIIDNNNNNKNNTSFDQLILQNYINFDQSMKNFASEDDETK